MAIYSGIVNGIDAMATPGLPPRCMAFIVDGDPEGVQVTAFEKNAQFRLEMASLLGIKVTVIVSDDDQRIVFDIAFDELDILDVARVIARLKGVQTEETPTRVRVLDRG